MWSRYNAPISMPSFAMARNALLEQQGAQQLNGNSVWYALLNDQMWVCVCAAATLMEGEISDISAQLHRPLTVTWPVTSIRHWHRQKALFRSVCTFEKVFNLCSVIQQRNQLLEEGNQEFTLEFLYDIILSGTSRFLFCCCCFFFMCDKWLS